MLVYPTGIPTGGTGYTIENAIWFDGSADELTFTPSQDGTGAGKKYTLSFWTKIIDPDSTGTFFSAGQSGGDSLHIQTDWTSGNPFLNFTDSSTSGSNWLRRVGTRVLRDSTAWIHICFAVDNSSGGGLAGTANAARVYINGVEDTSFASANSHPASSDTSRMTMQYEHVIGNGAGFNDFKSFYLAEFVIVDGQQLTPTSFGEYDDNGVWIPINVSGLTFGNNGCYLNFKVAPGTGNGAGTDVSGNGNHFTDVSMTTAQQVTDTCTDNAASDIGNYATWNPLTLSGGTLSEGNTKFSASGASQGCLATIGASSGKYFCEAVMDRQNNGTVFFGVKPTSASLMTTATAASPWNQQQNLYFSYFSLDNLGGNIIDPQTASAISDNSSKYSVADGSTVGCLLDLDNYQVRWYKLDSGSWVQITNSTAAASTVGLFPADAQWTFVARGSQSGDNVTANFGHKAFSATPPESAVALNTANLPAPTVTDPSAFYQNHTYTGNGTAIGSGGLTETFGGNSDLQPDFVWIKCRSHDSSHMLFDSVRGATNFLQTNSNGANDTVAETLTAFNPDGFTLGNNSSVNVSSRTYVAWCMKAGGAPTADNSAGQTPTNNSVFRNGSASTTAFASANIYPTRASIGTGISILKYTGNDSSNQTLATGLTGAADFAIIKRHTSGGDWAAVGIVGGTIYGMELNNTTAESSVSDQVTAFGNGTITINGGSANDPVDYSAFIFQKTSGLIGVGTYSGNNDPDGTYVIVDDGASGFRPAWLLLKNINDSESWVIFDSARSTYNPVDGFLKSDSSDGDGSATGLPLDFTANGFKQRNNSNMANEDTIIYLAFAEHPFGGDGVAQARAR
jgi:hypothetical protein